MSTTQRSESMNEFFDSYVHSRSTLKEFFDQFDHVLRRKVLDEKTYDFDSFNSTIPCISHYPIEKKYQDVYTNAKFKEVQEEFRCLMYCDCSRLKCEGAISTYQVSDEVKVDDCIKELRFCVYFNEDEYEVKCNCGLFEFRGILCKHALIVLNLRKVRLLPTKYILDRWRKDLKRTKYDDLSSNLDAQRYGRMMKNIFEVALITATSEDHYMDVMHHLDMLKVKYYGLRCEPSPPSHHLPSASSICNEAIDGVAVKSNKVFSTVVVWSKWRSPLKRKVPTVEKMVKRLQAKKKQSSDHNAKHKRRKNKTCQAMQESEVNTSETPLPSVTDTQRGYIIGTQDNAITQGSQEITELIAAEREKLTSVPAGGGAIVYDMGFSLFDY
ncbi:protein FAR-RED IMPAIRED RESPONSE 1-like isoform X2 [Corylus avellana]|uniref:protein FAR-RED IMPAIRED RESPONSE 1-like isoform X2 n=1 Tax=Corylus avellana TaxID=13451 RepID=UPI00286D56B3|nr:protein FAR-RED IMPAIRED RESPONSE 1-like isoform X2 [Corylus avellana]